MQARPVFRSTERWVHFKKHKADFGTITEVQYEEAAADFLTKPLANPVQCRYNPNASCVAYGTVHECLCRGDVIRFDTATDEFGVLGADGYLSTYYKLDPAFNYGRPNIRTYHDRCSL